jgi:RNA polymerase sigma-70 factor (sigma-E family)
MATRGALVTVEASDFDAFVRAQYRSVTGLAYVLCGDLGQAEDLTQEALAAAHQDWSRIGGFDDPGAWVRRVVANKATSLRRRRSAESRALARLGNRREAPDAEADDDEEVWSAVRALPRRQAQVMALTYLEDLDVSQVASILECGEATVKTHLLRAKATLAERLGFEHTQEDR